MIKASQFQERYSKHSLYSLLVKDIVMPKPRTKGKKRHGGVPKPRSIWGSSVVIFVKWVGGVSHKGCAPPGSCV